MQQHIPASVKNRWRRGKRGLPPLYWRVWLFTSASMVLLSVLLFDAPMGSVAAGMGPLFNHFIRFLTDFGGSGWIIAASAFLVFEGRAGVRRARTARCRWSAAQVSQLGSYILVSVVLSGVVANILKRVVGRARPIHFQEWGVVGFSPFANQSSFESFPSGHATTVGSLFVALAFLFPHYRIAFAACALALAVTRVIIGAHYPSDVIAGLALGAWFAYLTAVVYGRQGLLFHLNEKGWPTPKRLFSSLKGRRHEDAGLSCRKTSVDQSIV